MQDSEDIDLYQSNVVNSLLFFCMLIFIALPSYAF